MFPLASALRDDLSIAAATTLLRPNLASRAMLFNYAQPPAWLERSWLFRRLFLWRKLYLTKTRRGHYSQFAEDVSIRRLFPKGYRGFYVDVGCFHPKKYSNTWQLYRRGWRGVNVDIDAIKIEGFNLVRPDDTNVTCAISDAEGEVTYYSDGFYSLTITLDRAFAEQRDGYVERRTRCRPLTAVLDDTPHAGRRIDLLSVDAESHDLAVLESLDFERYEPRLVAVETHLPLLSQVSASPLYQFLESKGYGLVGWCGLTLLMASPSLQAELAADAGVETPTGATQAA